MLSLAKRFIKSVSEGCVGANCSRKFMALKTGDAVVKSLVGVGIGQVTAAAAAGAG